MDQPTQLNGIKRCGKCEFFKKGTITKNVCIKLHSPRHHANKICVDFEEKKIPSPLPRPSPQPSDIKKFFTWCTFKFLTSH